MRTALSSREWSRRVKGEGRARCGRPERHDVAVALRAVILDVRARDGAAWRGRDASGEPGTGREPGLDAWPTAPACGGERRRHGVRAKTEREEMDWRAKL